MEKLESLRKRINVRLVNNAVDFLKYTSKPTYITHKIFIKDQKMFMMNVLSGKICLTLATFQKIKNFLMRPIKKLLVK